MTIRSLAAFVSLFYLTTQQSADACTAFVLKNGDTIVLAKNLDWFAGDGFIMVNPAGIRKHAFTQEGSKQFSWRSCYRSITFNQFGSGMPLGGMNEKGVVIEELNYMPSRFPADDRPSLNEFQWVQYQLDTAAETEEVIARLEKITIKPLLVNLHYLVCDRNGHAAIIEFIDGKAMVYTGEDLPLPILVNNSYANSLKYIALHEGFGGSRIVSNGPESPERFVRAATAIQEIADTSRESLSERAYQILESVKQQDTQWMIVYNITTGTIQFKLRTMERPVAFMLNEIDSQGKFMMADVADPELHAGTVRFRGYSPDENSRLLSLVFQKLITETIISPEEGSILCRELSNYGGSRENAHSVHY